MSATLDPDATDLTTEVAQAQLDRHGPNEIAAAGRTSVWDHAQAAFAHPLALVLLAAAAVSAAVGEEVSAGLIAVVVLIGGTINFVQTYRSQVAVERLRAGVAPTATVRRDGQWVERPRAQIASGDVIRLSAGDLVPADAVLLTAQDLHVQQAALTGESVPVEKTVGPGTGEFRPDRPDVVFLGTSVFSGTATARVTATGRATAFGEVAAHLAQKAPETEFDRGLRRFGLFITQAVVLLVFAVLLGGVAFHRDPLHSLLFAVALAVGLTPEFLPMIVAVTLARGAVRMSRRHVIVKHLAAIQNLGSMDVLCSNKTGTLTRGEMELVRITDPFGEPSDKALLLAYLTFAVLLKVFHASEVVFHTGWFVESLATQTLVLFVIRTGGNPLCSRPSRALAVTVLAVVAVGVWLPYSPFAGVLGFVPLLGTYMGFVAAATGMYLALVEVMKRRVLRQAWQ